MGRGSRRTCSNPLTELDATSRAVLAALRPDWPADQVQATFLPGGYSNRSYRLQFGECDCVLRVIDTARSLPGVDREFELAVLSGPAAPLAPPLLAYRLPEGHMLTRFVDGPRIDEIAAAPATLAEYLSHLHGTLGPLDRTYDTSTVVRRYLAAAGAGVPAWAQAALEPPSAAETLRSSHNDLNPWNVIACGAHPRAWVTLDWEHAGVNDVWFDVVTLATSLRLGAEAERDLVLRYAGAARIVAPEQYRWDRLRSLFWLREYAWALLQQTLGNRRAEIVEQVRIAEDEVRRRAR